MHSIFGYSFHKTLEPWVATPVNDNMEAWGKSQKQKNKKMTTESELEMWKVPKWS
jgi:hypothetical protein